MNTQERDHETGFKRNHIGQLAVQKPPENKATTLSVLNMSDNFNANMNLHDYGE